MMTEVGGHLQIFTLVNQHAFEHACFFFVFLLEILFLC